MASQQTRMKDIKKKIEAGDYCTSKVYSSTEWMISYDNNGVLITFI